MKKRYYKNNVDPILQEELPFRISFKDSDGNTVKRTKQSTFTEEEILAAGWKVAPPRPRFIATNQKIFWNAETEEWDFVTINQDHKRYRENVKTRDILLEEAFQIKAKKVEAGLPLDGVNRYIEELNSVGSFNAIKVYWPQLDDANTA